VTDAVRDRNDLNNLVDALFQVPGLADAATRDERISDLRRSLRRPLTISRFDDDRHDLYSIVNTCLSCSGGLSTLTRLVRERHPGQASSRAFDLAAGLVASTTLSTPDQELLQSYLVGVPVGDIAIAVDSLVDAAELGSLQVWRDIPRAIRGLERLPASAGGVPQILTFVDRLSHVVGGTLADDLNGWIDLVAGGLGVSVGALGQLRGADTPRAIGVAASTPAQRADSGQEQVPTQARRSEDAGMIWGGVPIRNKNFAGRVALLQELERALGSGSPASVLPQTVHGMGGVGKTQLVIEYVYRHQYEYDIVWWVPSEQMSTVLSSLTQLAERLGLPLTDDRQQTALAVIDALTSTELRWLLVFDNADDPAALGPYVRCKGGHVVVTTRNQEWANVGQAIEVDVFQRSESVELLQRRSHDELGQPRIPDAEADRLAEKLGDLPLALEQAAAWFLATAMPIEEYIELLDSHIKDLLSEGKPANYPLTVAAFVTLAIEQLRSSAPAAAQLFELFAFLGGEPVSVSLLRRGGTAALSEPLRTMLASSIPTNRTVRDLNRFGLAKVDALQRVQVHRLVQRVLRESLSPELASQTLRNAQLLLAEANPGDPDENPEQAANMEEIGPHIEPADLVHAPDLQAKIVVLDHTRYLWMTGDYEANLRRAERASRAWEDDASDPNLGPDGELTLRAKALLANACRTLGDSAEAAEIARDAYDRMLRSRQLGRKHEYTLILGNQVGHDLRIAGNYPAALDFDLDLVTRHREVFEEDSNYTLRALGNLAVDYRMIGDFAAAYRLDQEIASRWENVGSSDPQAVHANLNLARSCYGLGAYQLGLEILDRWQPVLQSRLSPAHRDVLLAGRTRAILLRKLGRYDEALEVIRDNKDRVEKRFRPAHEFSVAAAVSYANALRERNRLDEAAEAIEDALNRYDRDFGPRHPLTLVARVNEAIIRRARGEFAQARALDEQCYDALAEVLGQTHPYTLCAAASMATDLARASEHSAAAGLSREVLDVTREKFGGGHEARDGASHPYFVMRAVNLSIDLRAIGQTEEANALLETSVDDLRATLGADHPELAAVERGERTEGDIEAPPT
jgi:tetratricopeptide (TPR) repeat protein